VPTWFDLDDLLNHSEAGRARPANSRTRNSGGTRRDARDGRLRRSRPDSGRFPGTDNWSLPCQLAYARNAIWVERAVHAARSHYLVYLQFRGLCSRSLYLLSAARLHNRTTESPFK